MQEISIEWADVKRRVIDSVQDGKRWHQAAQRVILDDLHRNPYGHDEWRGGSGAQTLDWLRNGFFAPELQASADAVTTAVRARAGWSEEDGDIDVGRLYGGYDDFYLEVSPSETKPGLKVTADIFFAASVAAKVVKQYGAWLAGLIGSLEASGYDLEVGVGAPIDKLYEGTCPRTRLTINVKRHGELSDFTEWSQLFSPTGVRVTLFTAFGVASEKVGKRQTAHMATSLPSTDASFGVTYDEAENHLHISADQRFKGREFPAELMTDRLARVGLI
jgi:hypothetical protein